MSGLRAIRPLAALWPIPCALAVLAVHTPQQPTFKGGIDVVVVDVRVVDRAGRPVPDLQPGDFTVTVEGKPRAIVTAGFTSYPVAAAPARPDSAPAPGVADPTKGSDAAPFSRGRTIVLFVDEENIRGGYGKFAGDAAAKFVDRLQSDDRVGLIIPFSRNRIAPTTDRAAVKAGLGSVVGHMRRPEVSFRQQSAMGPTEAFERHYDLLRRHAPPDSEAEGIIADVRQRAHNSLRDIAGVLDALRAEPGAKTVVLVSEELPVYEHLEERAAFNFEFRQVGEAAARAQAMLYVLQLDRPVEDPEFGPAQHPGDRALRSFGLETVVGVTGGKRLLVSGQPEGPFDRIALELSGQYLLGFRSEPADRDGKVHPIKVTVRRKGVEVRARQMFAYPAAGQAPPREPPPPPAARNLPADQPKAPPPAPAETRPPPAVVTPADPAPDVAALLPRVAAYVREYAEQMSVVIGVERYTQWLQRDVSTTFQGLHAYPPRAISRSLVSEFALVRTKDDWDGFRNVYEVDGKPVADAKDRIAKLFTEAPATAAAQSRKIAAESARYNLGALQRTFNVPTVALFFLSAANQARFTFTRDKDEEIGGVKAWKVKFEETRRPTIIATSAGKDMPVKGEVWVDPASGRVLKTHMQIDSEMRLPMSRPAPTGSRPDPDQGTRVQTSASVTVTYTLDAKLNMLVPAEMLESYQAPMRSAFTGDDEMTRVNCRATYTDFRRFETSGRLVVK
jgi:VWFA-related protein